MPPGPGIELETQWWEASALTTASLSYPLSNVFLSYPLSNVFISVSVYLENVRIGLSGNVLNYTVRITKSS